MVFRSANAIWRNARQLNFTAQYSSGQMKGGVGTAKGRVLDQLSYCTFFSKAHNNFMY